MMETAGRGAACVRMCFADLGGIRKPSRKYSQAGSSSKVSKSCAQGAQYKTC